MKTKFFFRSLLIAILALGICASADAQLKGVLNKAKKAVKEATSDNSSKSSSSATTTSSNSNSQVKSKITDNGPECPEVLKLEPSYRPGDPTDTYMEELTWGLRTMSHPEAKALAAKLNARIKWDLEQIKKLESKDRTIEEGDFYHALRQEVNNWDKFVGKAGTYVAQMTSINWEKDAQGKFFYRDKFPLFHTGHWISGVPASLEGDIKGNNSMVSKVDGKFVFCYSNGEKLIPIVAKPGEIRVAKLDANMALNVGYLLDGFPLEWWRADNKGTAMEDTWDKCYWSALMFVQAIAEAVQNNSPSNIKYEAMPKPGAMNASMKSKILALEKSAFPDVVDVVITSNNWEIQKNAAGQPVRRVIYGYSIVKTENGKMATRVSWAEDHQGGGKYGAVHGYGNGMETFYVK
ncbi:MAG: hypothetical protein J6Y40_08805 [Bacteroidales bacterium]|nr:hypothetical protein [Bacteroidales bacterium]